MGTSRDLLEQEDSNDESAKEYLNHDWGNHDENAKVQRIARDEDLPEEAVRENLDELTRTRKKYDFSNHPKSAEFFADPDNASVVGDDVEHYKSLEQTLRDRKEPIFGERTAKLAWNAMTEARASITRALGTIAEGQREKIIRRYLGDDAYERAKAIDEKAKKEGAYVDPIEELSKEENWYAYNEGIDFSRKRTPETVKKAFSEEGVISGIGEAGGFMYDTGVESMATQIPMMAGKTVGAPFYLLNLTEQIAQENARNSGEEMTDKHMIRAAPWAVASYALDWIGFKGMVGAGKSDELLKEVAEGIAAKTVVKEGLKAGGREAGTEAFQEGFLEYMGERFGTEAKIELSEMLETGAWAGLAGGGMGVAIGTPSAYLNDRERRIKVLRDNERRRDINSVDGQLTIESVLDVVQQMPSVERSPEHVEKFMQAVGPDKQIIVTNEGLKAASTIGLQIPEGMRSPLGDAVLRISDFVNQVANKPDLMAAIRPHLKMRQEDMTQFEMDKQEGNPELAYLFGKADKASKLEKENRAAIEGVVKAMAGTRRMSEGTARKLTKFLSEYANRYVEDAAKKGVEITPKDAIDAMKLRFVGPKVDMDKEVNFEKAAARMLPREEFDAFKKLPKPEQLDRVARHYAALPVAQGGLGLSATNTREDRESALGVKFKSGEDYVPQVAKSKPLEQSVLPDKITIDGVEKHTRNSNGDYIAADEQGIRNFYEWFGASKVVDAEGRPLVVYHGTDKEFDEFDVKEFGRTDQGEYGIGFYFSPYEKDASLYAGVGEEFGDKESIGRVISAYLSLENPYYSTPHGGFGHTLDTDSIKSNGNDGVIVKEDDDRLVEIVAFSPTQIKSVANVGSFSRETGNIYYQKSESGFFSQLQKAAEELKQEKGTPDQMLAMLKKEGVKEAEIEATGLKEFMELAGKSITKAQIVEFISNNGVQVETTVLGAESEAKEEGFSVIDDDGRRMASFETEEEAYAYATENGGFVEPSARQKARESRARNTNYTLPGGENHVELVLSIPNIDGWNQGDTTHYGDIADGKAVAWVRANDRTDADGKKVLFIEEIQSKRAQEGRSKGFKGDSFSRFEREKAMLRAKYGVETIQDVRKSASAEELKKLDSIYDEVQNEKHAKNLPTSAPFVEKTDAWVSLAMKRMITYAVENGYDRIAWTTGEQQADRYDLSKQVDKITWQKNTDGTITVEAYRNGDEVISEVAKDIDGVSGLIGKDLAKKIGEDISGTRKVKQTPLSKDEEGRLGFIEGLMRDGSSMSPKDWTVYNTLIAKRDGGEAKVSKKVKGTIEGDGLKVGGEGMKSFYDKIIPSIAKEVTKKMDGKVGEISIDNVGNQPGFDITDKMREQVQGPGLPLFQNKPDPLGATYQMPLGDRVIKLFEKSNPSTMLHEMSHLFLLMEQDFAEKYGMTETHKDLLKWLGVDSFDQITKNHHEQFAGSFEAYIMEGKSPSIALSDVFAAAKHWMIQVYEFIRNIPNQKIDPEISSIFDRLLATEQQLEEVKGSPMYNQFFADKDEAGWSTKDWFDYIGLQARRENKAKETVDQKLMKEWKRMRTKEWVEERNAIQETEEAVLKASPVYRAMSAMREFKLNRDQALEAMGLEVPLTAKERAEKSAIPKPTDSLLVFAAKRGGLNIEAYKKAGIDPADMKKTQSGVFGKPVFTKDGMTPAQFNEAATEAGYMESRGYTIDAETYDDLVDDNDVLDLVTRSVIQGEEFFTVEGDAIRQEEAEKQRYLDQYFEEHGQYPPEEVVEETPEEKLAKSLKKYLSTDGMPVEMTATEHGYGSAKEMIEAVLAAPKIKEQAKLNADEAMIAKYGTLLDDATLEAEVRDAVQNEEQAKLLLMEIKALGKVAKKKEINRDYLKMKATRLVDEMKRSDMRTGGVYRRMVKAAEAAKKANAEAAKIRAAIAKEKEAAAGELAAEVGERAVEAQKQLEKAKKDHADNEEKKNEAKTLLEKAKESEVETAKSLVEKNKDISYIEKAVEKESKKLERAKKKGVEEDESEFNSLSEMLDQAKESRKKIKKDTLSKRAEVVRLEKEYSSLSGAASASKKILDSLEREVGKQTARATEKEGKVEEAQSETAKKLAELDADLVAVAEKALEFKIQHLANHYLYQEITERRAAMDRQLTYLRRVDGKDYDPKVVDPDYIAQAKKLIRLYNTVTKSKKDEQRLTEELSGLLTWYDTQVKAAETLDQDEGGTGNRQPLLWLSEELIAALAAKREGTLAEFKLKQISNMTAAEVQGLYDTIKHIRYIGGKTSEDAKAEYQKSQEEIADNIKENAGKTIKRKHEKNVFDRTKESLGAYWHSMESSFLMFSKLDGFSNGPIMKHWESFIDAVNKHIELERDFAKTIDGIMRPILVKIASPIKVTITKEDGVAWSLSKQARFVLLLNMGNQSNIDAVLQGMNANFGDSYTYNDLMQMVGGMSKAELEAANKIWAYKDQTLWPLISAIQRKISGVSAAKIEPVPFVVNGVKMIGGHYRLHYKADQKDQGRDFELESVGKMKMLMGKQASQIERVGSGGREVDLEHLHLYTDISQELRFIAFKEFSISISKFLNGANNPVRAAIIQHHGAEFLKYLEDTINGVVNRPANAMDMFSRGSRAIRSNMVYSYLSFSLRSIVQAATSVAPMMSQLGEARTLMAFMEFWSNPIGNFKKVDSMSMAMKERLKFVNHEATTELSKLSVWSPVVNQMKKAAFMPHAVIDAFFAYPAWMGAKRKYLDENPVDSKTDFKRREKLANDFADLTMKQIMGSGHKADVGGVFSSTDEMVKSILFMGTFSNSMFNTNAYNIEKFKAGKMPWYELARRQGWMMIGAPLIWMAVLDEFPDLDDEDYWLELSGKIAGYNLGMLVAANHVYNYAVNDFEFTLPLMKAVESAVGLSRSGKALVMGDEEFDLKMQAKIVRDLGPLVPMFGGSEMSRIMKGIEEERDWYSTYVTGKRD